MHKFNISLAGLLLAVSGSSWSAQPMSMEDPVIKEFISAQALPVPDRIFKYAEACVRNKTLALHLPRMIQVSCLKRLASLQGMSIGSETQVGLNNLSELEVAVEVYFVVLTGE